MTSQYLVDSLARTAPNYRYIRRSAVWLAGVMFAVVPLAHGASATWNGTTDAIWATGTNWSTTPVPGTGDTATFNNAGGAVDVINLGAGVTINSLLFDTVNVAAYTIGSGPVGSQTLTLNTGITLNSTINANQLINANVALGANATIANNDTSNTLTIAGRVSGSGFNLTKTGAGTLILSGLSTTAANNYTGTTILDGGTTTLTADASFTGGLTFGATGGSANVSNLNLNNASATFAGAMLVQTSNTGSPNTITIGAGEKLTINNNVTFSGLNYRSRLTVSGAGGWDVISSNGTFGGVGTTNGADMTVDMSGLSEFNANLRTGGAGSDGGLFRVGPLTNTGTNSRDYTVSLATNSTISADQIEISMNGGTLGTSLLSLGNGTQTINSDNIIMSAGTRQDSRLSFRTADGTVKIRGNDGGNTTRSNLTMLSGVTNGNIRSSTFDVTAHDADLLFNTVSIYDHTVDTTSSLTNTYTATFSFDRGTLDATTFRIATKSSGNLNNPGIAIANIGSSANLTNSATLGTVNMGVLSTAGSITAINGQLNPELNIRGTATTVGFTTLSMANYTGTTGATLNSKVNISGGSTTGTGGINMAAGNKNGITSSLNLTGGTLSVGTSGVSATNGIFRTTTGTATTTLTLNGGSLNLNGNSIGAAGANAIDTQFQSGTLRNVGHINGGGALTKTTSGTLILDGTNTYTGATNVNAGTLQVGVGGVGSTHADSAFTLNGTAATTILAGTGTVGGNVTVTSGTIAPGDTGGSAYGLLNLGKDLVLSGGSVVDFRIGGLTRGTQFDALNIGNGLTYGGALNLNFTSTFNNLDAWNLFDFVTHSGSFSSIAFSGSYTGSLTNGGSGVWTGVLGAQDFTFTESTGVLSIGVIPEPSRVILILAGILGVAMRRRRAV